ncbi:MAG: efflux transporter outer membrane subunit [Verrucomicrobiota bacterium]
MNSCTHLTAAASLCILIYSSCAPSNSPTPQLETPTTNQWKYSSTRPKTIRPQWWRDFNDPILNQLLANLSKSNLSLQASLARLEQARAQLGIVQSQLRPTLDAQSGILRSRSSDDEAVPFVSNPLTQYQASLQTSWEIDLWSRLKRQVQAGEADLATATAQTNDLALSLQAQTTQTYLNLRFLEEDRELLTKMQQSLQSTLDLVTHQVNGGRGTQADLSRAQAEVRRIEAEIARAESPIARLQNALAVLTGRSPSQFHLTPRPTPEKLPTLTPRTPLEVLSHRPDLAVAIARLTAANARVGVAHANFYPKLTLLGSSGFSSLSADSFLQWSSRTFSLGPSLSLPLFQGGRLKSELATRQAEQKEALLNYQQASLQAFREIEDTLATLNSLNLESRAQTAARKSTENTVEITANQFESGRINALVLNQAQRDLLQDQRRALAIRRLQFENSVTLIKVLGGGTRLQGK